MIVAKRLCKTPQLDQVLFEKLVSLKDSVEKYAPDSRNGSAPVSFIFLRRLASPDLLEKSSDVCV